jgi:hypothetical protein
MDYPPTILIDYFFYWQPMFKGGQFEAAGDGQGHRMISFPGSKYSKPHMII